MHSVCLASSAGDTPLRAEWPVGRRREALRCRTRTFGFWVWELGGEHETVLLSLGVGVGVGVGGFGRDLMRGLGRVLAVPSGRKVQ